MITNKIYLDFARRTPPAVVFAKQGDKSSRYIEVTPLENGLSYLIPAGVVAKFVCSRPDGHPVMNDYPTVENGKIIVPLTKETLAVAGECKASISLYDNSTGEVLSTQNFIIVIEENPMMITSPSGSAGGSTIAGITENTTSILTERDLAGVEDIRSYAFYGCSELRSVSLPDTLKSIGTYAFYRCSNLQDIELPSGLTSLGARCFYECKALEKIVIPEGVTNLPIYAFNGCSSLKTVILVGDTVKTAAGSNIFTGTYFADNEIPIYIATINADVDDLVAAYSEATNWSDYFYFAPISEYEGEW